MVLRAGEKRLLTRMHKDVQDRVLECRVRGVTVRFPTPIGEIKFNAAPFHFAAIDANRCAGEIGTGFPVPCSELHDLDPFSAAGTEAPPEIPREPARLKFE